MEKFDVVIVGARCAGASLAILLARRGLHVCLLDRVHFPRETPSTHVIQPVGAQILDELGVLGHALAAGGARLDRLTLVNEHVRIDGVLDPDRFPTPGLCVRRLTLDALLVDAAADAGAEVRTGCRVSGVLRDETDRVVGVETMGGAVFADLTVGADGVHSTVAATVDADEYLGTPPGRIPAWAYFEGVGDAEGRLRIGRIGNLAFLASPTDGGLYMVAVAVDATDAARFHADRRANYAEAVTCWPELADLIAGSQRVGPIRVMADWRGYFRRSAGPGWALVGDAGHFKDFAAAQGISDALRQSDRLADAIDVVGDPSVLDARLQQWWRWRDRDAYAMSWLAQDMGAPGASSPLITNVMREIADDGAATRQLLQVLNHELAPSKLFTVRRLLKAAARTVVENPRAMLATVREIAGRIGAEAARMAGRRALR